jgi:hypothetical protein
MDRNALTQAIVTRMTAAGEALAAWAAGHRPASLAEHEATYRQVVAEAAGAVLTAMLEVALLGGTPGAASAPQACPGCGQRCLGQSWRPRQVHTTVGRVRWTRPWYHCRTCHQGWAPFDQTLGVAAHAKVSAALTDWLVRLGPITAYREAAALLATLTGQVVPPETVRQHTVRVGSALADAETAAVAQVAATREPAEPVEPVAGTLTVEADGASVCYRDGWHEVKLGAVGGADAAGRLTGPSYLAVRADATTFGGYLLAEAARRGALTVQGWTGGRLGRGLAVLPEVAVLGDGAPWIWAVAAEHFGTRVEILDFYHASQHVWAAAQALHPTDELARRAWARARLHELRHMGPTGFRAALAAAHAPTPEAATELQRQRAYFRTHQARLDYPRLAARGLPIGSGAVEGAARHLIKARLKRPGARWSPAGARAVMTLRARLLSHRPLAA